MAIMTACRSGTASTSTLRPRTSTPLIRRLLILGAACIRRHRERTELRQMGLRDRQDIGHTRVNTELSKPFWKH